MSEFKFVCPVCHQHIKCESWRSNSMMECPSCFQRIIVPPAPADDNVELIITGSKAHKRMASRPETNLGRPSAPSQPAKNFPVAGIAFVILLCAAIVAGFVFRGVIFKSAPTGGTTPVNNDTSGTPPNPAPSVSGTAVPAVPAPVIHPDSKGNVFLSATNAELHGSQLRLEMKGGIPDIGWWSDGNEWVSWTAQITNAGVFKVIAAIATDKADAGFVLEVGDEQISAQCPVTGSWDNFQALALGQIQIKQPGDLVVKVRAKDIANWKAINLNSVQLIPVKLSNEPRTNAPPR